MYNQIKPLNVNSCCVSRIIPLSFDNSLSYLEMLCAIQSKLKEVIEQLNFNTDVIKNIDVNFNQIYQILNELDTKIDTENNKLYVKIVNMINELESKVYKYVNNESAILKNYINNEVLKLHDKIEKLIVGQVTMVNPFTGQISPVTDVVYTLTQFHQNGVTCSYFDSLELTCNTFDEKEITAYEFDFNSANIL